MPFKKLTQTDIDFFASICKAENVLFDAENIEKYGWDYTHDNYFAPEVILHPTNTDEVSKILKYCNDAMIPVTPRGAGTSLSGGALPVFGGVVLSMERFNKIIKIDTDNLQALVEPGVINEAFNNAVQEKGLYYPPDPASRGSCFLGGNVAHSSGGPRAIKYGTTREYILNLEVVLADGSIMWTGADTVKFSTGYNLTQLFVGSEGTLGVITKIVTKLIPNPRHNMLMLAAFANAEKACEAVSAILGEGILPSALEFMERDAIDVAISYTKSDMVVPDWVAAHLIIEVDGNHPEALLKDCEKINEVLEKYEVGEVLFADSSIEKDKLWALRRKVGEATKAACPYKEEDTVVPRAYLPFVLKKVKEVGAKYGFRSVCYGHAGDGNLHVNILKDAMSDEQWNNGLTAPIKEIFDYVLSVGGTISGEHGIGYVQREFMSMVYPPFQMQLMQNIKKVFDPNGILNPGKIFM
ncbi:MAG: FAD-binding protein [Bacteroidetes bacterium]|nr:FAD-binding protein [Bacteroidota bacterium]